MKEEQTFFRAFLALSMYMFVSSASASNNDSSKPLTRLRNDSKSVKRNIFILEHEYDPFLGLAGLYDGERRVVYAPMSMMLDESSTLPSSQPTYSFEPTLSPSLKTTLSPTIDDPNFGKVEGKRRISSASVGVELTMSAVMILVVSMLVA